MHSARLHRVLPRILFALTSACALTGTAFAQLPSPSSRALAMAENHTAAARGYTAIAWNAALLAMDDAPRRSLAIMPVRGVAGLTPISLNDISDWQGRTVPNTVRERWLRAIESSGGQKGSAGGDATYVAAQFGRFGFQASTSLRAIGDLTPGAAELLFFGNAGRTGAARQLEVGGSELRAHAASTVALSYALPLPPRFMRAAALGVTAKYTVGHTLLLGNAAGSADADNAALDLHFPLVSMQDGQFSTHAGGGLGFDFGFAKRSGNVTVGAAVQNAINTFSWDESKLEYREGLAQFDRQTRTVDFDARSLSSASVEMRRVVRAARFARTLATGIAWVASNRVTVASDARVRLGHTTLAEPASYHIGAGGEYRLHEKVVARAGLAVIEAGYQAAGGVGTRIGPTNVAASVMRRSTAAGSGTVTMLSLFSTILE